nr:alpha-amylase family glycosyl hydrolase [Lapillicoccus jejuensis]
MTATSPAADSPDEGRTWWRHAVIYQVYPRSWADGDGDGIGDLPGITTRLPYLKDLGVDAVWFSPFYTSPQADAGYDVADYRDIDPLFGSLADADAMLAEAKRLGLKVIVDLVPNHSSDEHPWFQAALAAAPGSPERARYLFRDGKGTDGQEPPNNWQSVFGGPAWTRVTEADGTPGQWYLHLFDTKQPDFDWTNPTVRDEFESVLRFWLDRGVAGFRVDVAHGLVKEDGLPDWAERTEMLHSGEEGEGEHRRAPMWDQDGVHEVYEGWRRVLDSYGAPDRILCAEAWVEPAERMALYVRRTEMHQAFNFAFLESLWHAPQLRETIAHSLEAAALVDAPTTWVLSNHDVIRHASRLGLRQDRRRPNGIGADDPQPDAEVGLRRARAATTLMLGLPGAAYLYQGEELGLPDSTDMPDEVRQDPAFVRTGGAEKGRDGCRVPMPWEKDAPALGFNTTGATWLPQPASYADLAVDQQQGRTGSTLELYRSLLATRRELGLGSAHLRWLEGYGDTVVALASVGADRADVAVLTNLGSDPVTLPEGEVLVVSGDLDADGRLPLDTSAWVRLAD